MRQEEFFQSFQEALAGEVSDRIIQENISYYKNYINTEIAKGRTLDEVLDSLGNPRLLAKTIINTSSLSDTDNNYYENSNETYESYNSYNSWEDAGNTKDTRSFKQKLKEIKMPQWLKGLISIIVIALCIGVAFTVISYLAPVILIVVVIVAIINLIRNIYDGY